MNKTILLSAVFFGLTAVLLGAFGAHGLQDILPGEKIKTWETAVSYQMYHALLLLWVGGVNLIEPSHKKWVFYCLLTGIVLFSFSLYFLALDPVLGWDMKKIALLTPLGGGLLITGWVILGHRIYRLLG